MFFCVTCKYKDKTHYVSEDGQTHYVACLQNRNAKEETIMFDLQR